MKFCYSFLFILGSLCLIPQLSAQDTQTLRGRVVSASGDPVTEAEIKVSGTSASTYTDEVGRFELAGLPTVRQLTILCIVDSDTLGTNQVVLNKARVEEIEFKVPYYQIEGASIMDVPLSKMVSRIVPSDPIHPPGVVQIDIKGAEQSIAAADDLSRMVMRLPGVKSWADNLADIVIRANSPAGLMWRVEGIDIPNPNHFARKGNTGGGITMFSAQVLGDATFSRGAMAPEYGNSFAGAFDLNFRKGNTYEREYRARIGAIGLDFAAEGPIKRGQSSYLVNYRYSFLGILSAFGFNLNAPFTSNNFQDLSFNLYLPTKDLSSTWTVFGVGGLSREFWDVDPGDIFVNKNATEERIFDTETGVIGTTYSRPLNSSSLFKAAVAVMGNRVTDRDEQIDISTLTIADTFDTQFVGLPRDVVENEVYSTGRISTHLYYQKYWGNTNLKTTLKAGLQASHMTFSFLHDDVLPFQDNLTTLVSGEGSSQLLQPYVQVVKPFFKQEGNRVRQTWKIVGGVHTMFLTLNNKATVDPRLAVTYNYSQSGVIGLSYGLHSMIVPLGSYFTQDAQGEFVNKDLDMIRSHHVVASIRQEIPNVGVLLVEGYYQSMFNVPVSVTASPYWLLNDRDGYARQALVSDGTGINRGIDISFSRPLVGGIFWTIAGSFYQSTTVGSDGIERQSSYIGREPFGIYTANTIGGEFPLNKKKTVFLQLGTNIIAGTGTRFIALDSLASLEAEQLVLDSDGIYSESTGNYFRIDTRTALRFGRWLIAIDLQNATNQEHIRGTWMRFGVPSLRPQSGLTPLFSVRADF